MRIVQLVVNDRLFKEFNAGIIVEPLMYIAYFYWQFFKRKVLHGLCHLNIGSKEDKVNPH